MNCSIVHNFKGKELVINLKQRVHFSDVENIIDGIVEGVFSDGVYIPSRFDYFYWYLILAQYSDMDLEIYDADEFYELIEDEEFLDKIRSSISSTQVYKIKIYATKLVELKLNEHPLKSIVDNFISTIGDAKALLNEIESKPELLDGILNYISDKSESNT